MVRNLPPKKRQSKDGESQNNITVSLRLAPSLHQFYKSEATARGLTISDLVARVLEEGRAEIEKLGGKKK